MAREETRGGVEYLAAHLWVANESVYRWIDSKSFSARRAGHLVRFQCSEDEVGNGKRGVIPRPAASEKPVEARPEGRKTIV